MDTSKETFKALQQDDVLSAADVASNVVIKPEEEYCDGYLGRPFEKSSLELSPKVCIP